MSGETSAADKGLLERLSEGPVICAEGYLFEMEHRGYVSAGGYVPEVVIEHPEAIEQLHREFLRAGSDIIEAFTYYGHREKLRLIGKEDMLEDLNRNAVRIARKVASEGDALVAGNVCNTNIFLTNDQKSKDDARAMFEEQVGWAVEEGVDCIIAETFSFAEEAEIALDVIRQTGLPSVITMGIHRDAETYEGLTPEDCCKRLEDAGADVVGLNCMRGPETMMLLLRKIRLAVKCHVAALPVPYRTSESEPTFHHLYDANCSCLPEGGTFPTALDPFTCNRYEIAEFTKDAVDIGVHYLGVCCGAKPHHIRSMAEALGRRPPASKYSPDMSKHAYFGDSDVISEEIRNLKTRL